MAEPARITRMLAREHLDGEIRLPVIELRGAGDGPTLTISAGIHGCEYAGIEAAVRLGSQIDPRALRGRLIIVTVANIPGFLARREVVCPIDDCNVNRIFPGNPDGSYSESLADLIFTGVVQGSDAHIDMHGGDVFEALVPYIAMTRVADDAVNSRVMAMARAYGLEYILEVNHLPGATAGGMWLSEAAREAGIPSILPEVGGEGVLLESDAARHVQGVKNVMHLLGMIDDLPRTRGPARELVSDFWRINHSGLVYPTVGLRAHVHAGDVIGLVKDWFGDTIEEVRAPREAWIIAVVTTLAARQGAVIYQVAH